MTFTFRVICTLALIVLIILQTELSERKQWYLGGILPILYIVFVIWYLSIPHEKIYYFRMIIPFVLLLKIWSRGRNKVKSEGNIEESR